MSAVCHPAEVKLLCGACGQAGALELSAGATAQQAWVRCQQCGAKEPVTLAGAAAASAAADGAEQRSEEAGQREDRDAEPARQQRCPKCQTHVGQRPACPTCGLTADRMSTFASAREAASPELAATWQAALEAWTEQARHDAFVQAAAAAGAFAFAAGKYQEAARTRPDDTIAPRQLARVRRTAEAAMLASAQVRHVQQTPYRNATAILVLLVVAAVAGGVYTTFLRSTRGSAGQELAPRPAAPTHPARPSPGRPPPPRPTNPPPR